MAAFTRWITLREAGRTLRNANKNGMSSGHEKRRYRPLANYPGSTTGNDNDGTHPRLIEKKSSTRPRSVFY